MTSSRVISAKLLSSILAVAFAALTVHCGGGDGGGVTPPEDPSIDLSSTSASFTMTAGGAPPAPQTIEITNGGGGTLDGLSTSISYTAGQATGWLTSTLSATEAPSTLILTVAPGSLTPATYTANIAVTSAAATNSPQTVAVSLTIGPSTGGGPLVALSSANQTFTAPEGGANPAAQTVEVTNGGDGTLDGLTAAVTYTAGQPTGWLNASLSAPAAPSTLTLRATTGSLTAGTYTASVAVTSPAAGNSPQPVAVTFTVAPATAGPLIALASSTINFTGAQGGADPADQTVAVTNGGGGTLNGLAASVSYATGQPTGWLDASLNRNRAPATLTLAATTGSLTPGTYTATVAVTSGVASNSPQNVAVTFVVAPPPPTIVLSSTTLTFTAAEAGTDPAAQTVAVTSGTAGALSGLAATVAYAAGQPTGWLTATLSQPTAPSTLTVTPDVGSLTAGTYTAEVAVTSSVASNSPQTVSVTFIVTPPPDFFLYGVNSSSDGLSVYDSRTGAGSFIGLLDPNNGLYTTPVAMALRPTDSKLFVWSNSGDAGAGVLLTVDPATGQGTSVSTTPQGQLGALAFSPSGSLYGVLDELYAVDPTTGVKTLIGSLGLGLRVAGADFGCDGVLYGVDLTLGTERLVTINTETGAATVLATLSQDIGVIGSIAFMPVTGTLVGSAFGALGNILFDLSLTGTVSNVRSISAAAGGTPQGMASNRICTF